jgi:hypothetical protein
MRFCGPRELTLARQSETLWPITGAKWTPNDADQDSGDMGCTGRRLGVASRWRDGANRIDHNADGKTGAA